MIRKLWRTTLATAELGASALTTDVIFGEHKRLAEWETLTCEDATEGDFMRLADGTRMHYVGRGPCDPEAKATPVVLIHGLMSSTYEWAKNIDALAAQRRVWAVDLIGFGFSSRLPHPEYSLKYFARTIRDFLDAQGIERATIIGHSLGGAVTLQFAHDYAERVDKLVLIDPAAYFLSIFKAAQWAVRVPKLPRRMASAMLSSPEMHRTSLRNALGDPLRLDEEMLSARVRASRVKGTVDALLAMAASPHASQSPQGLKQTQARTLILWGDKDLILPVEHGTRLARDLPNAELVILEGAGHVPNEEFPDIVNNLIVNFLDKE